MKEELIPEIIYRSPDVKILKKLLNKEICVKEMIDILPWKGEKVFIGKLIRINKNTIKMECFGEKCLVQLHCITGLKGENYTYLNPFGQFSESMYYRWKKQFHDDRIQKV